MRFSLVFRLCTFGFFGRMTVRLLSRLINNWCQAPLVYICLPGMDTFRRIEENAMELTKRIDVLDYLRGVALLGIILVNIGPLLSVGLPATGSLDASYWRLLYLFVEGRFYTIFTFLFGVGFYLFVSRANEKGKNGVVLFLRRIFVLFLFGLIHVKFHPGEALAAYAVSGLVILPFYKAPKEVNLIFGMAMLAVCAIFSIKIFMIVPLMLLGIAVGQFRIFEKIAMHIRKIAVFTVVLFIVSVLGLIYQYQYAPFITEGSTAPDPLQFQRFFGIGIMIGPIVSAFYAGLLILLVQYSFFQKILAPLKSYGRMALTNYISQTVLILLAGKLFDLYNRVTNIQTLYLCLVIHAILIVFSVVWLRYFRFGPLEWIWRMATYFEIPQMRNRKNGK